MVTSLALVGALVLAPNELPAIRLLGVSLAWWATLAAHAVAAAVLLAGGRAGANGGPS